jgi:hypothetical protein
MLAEPLFSNSSVNSAKRNCVLPARANEKDTSRQKACERSKWMPDAPNLGQHGVRLPPNMFSYPEFRGIDCQGNNTSHL